MEKEKLILVLSITVGILLLAFIIAIGYVRYYLLKWRNSLKEKLESDLRNDTDFHRKYAIVKRLKAYVELGGDKKAFYDQLIFRIKGMIFDAKDFVGLEMALGVFELRSTTKYRDPELCQLLGQEILQQKNLYQHIYEIMCKEIEEITVLPSDNSRSSQFRLFLLNPVIIEAGLSKCFVEYQHPVQASV